MAGKKEIEINVVPTGENQEPQQVSVTFDEEKLDALHFYMKEKGTTMDEVLQDHMVELYRTFVPANARRYLDRNDPEHETAEAEHNDMTPEQRKALNAARREKRKAEKQTQGNNPVPSGGEGLPPHEDEHSENSGENQGMTLGGLGA